MKAAIANMTLPEITKVYRDLDKLSIQSFYIFNSCYAAGTNLVKLQDNIQVIINKIVTEQNKIAIQQGKKLIQLEQQLKGKAEEIVEAKKGITTFLSEAFSIPFKQVPIIAVQATSGQQASTVKINLHLFFTQLAEYLEPTKKDKRPSMDSVLKSLCLSRVENLPSVRFPGTNTFFRAANLGHMEIITWSKLRSLRFETPKTEIIIPIECEIKYAQIFPVNLADCALIIKGSLPFFISKISWHCPSYHRKNNNRD